SATLREYQKYGVNWLNTLDYLGFGGILADEMGLGKTLQIISFLANKKESGALIIAPTSLIYNWQNEFKKFAPSLSVKVINGTKDQRALMLNDIKESDIVITTYNLLKRDLDFYKDRTFNYCILDEAQYIKNSSSINAKAVKEIKSLNRFALTGTPIENSLMELWSIFDFIMPGFLYDEKRFSVRYHKKLNESKEVLSEVQKLISPFILRRYKKDVLKELPEKIEKQLFVSLPIEQQKVYATYANYAKDIISKKVKDDEFKTSKIEILSYITRLRQLCIDPSIVMEDYNNENGKIEALIEILNNSIEEGHKVLIFSQFTSVLKNLITRLRNEDISNYYLDGSIPSEKRLAMVQSFNNDDTSVFLISLKAGGTGLNLTSADIVIHLDPWWNPAVEDQASDRAHRLGQKNVVEVIKLIAKDTIEEKVMHLQNKKRTLTSSLINSEDESFKDISSLSEEDIIELFT
ncbi:DEAD/DEAH box helicase, partial [Clostridium sp.]|uniref:DEAD/DEAH box helicase n=1 Tax=Clostridium sp. TaxID=1506 RepID=UPI003F2E7AD1